MTTTPRRRARREPFWTLQRRRYLYSIATAAAPVAVTYGLIDPESVAPTLALAAAVLGVTGLALTHPTTE